MGLYVQRNGCCTSNEIVSLVSLEDATSVNKYLPISKQGTNIGSLISCYYTSNQFFNINYLQLVFSPYKAHSKRLNSRVRSKMLFATTNATGNLLDDTHLLQIACRVLKQVDRKPLRRQILRQPVQRECFRGVLYRLGRIGIKINPEAPRHVTLGTVTIHQLKWHKFAYPAPHSICVQQSRHRLTQNEQMIRKKW